MLLAAPDSLVVSITKPHGLDGSDQQNTSVAPTSRKVHEYSMGVNGLDVLNFTYKVCFMIFVSHNTLILIKCSFLRLKVSSVIFGTWYIVDLNQI